MRSIIPISSPSRRRWFSASPPEAQTLKTVQDRGTLICGVSQGIAGFSIKDENGSWSGFDVDFCRAVAAAIFNDPSKVQYVPLSTYGPVRRAQEQADRRAVSQLDVDDGPRG